MSRLIGDTQENGSESLAAFTYPYFWELTQSMYKNNWRPHEIGSGNDRSCYATKLSEEKKQIYNRQFGFLTFMDVNIQKPLAWLLAITTNPEVSGWIARQIGEESNHSECVSDDTEILTPDGWKLFKDLEEWDKVAQYHDDGTISFTHTLRIVSYEHEGDLVRFSGHGYDLLVTPNHRCVRREGLNTGIEVTLAERCSLHNFQVPVSGKLSQDSILFGNMDRLRIAFQADGTLLNAHSKVGARTGLIAYRFNFQKTRKIKRLLSILEEEGIKHKITFSEKRPGYHHITIWVPRETRLVKDFDWVDMSKVDSVYLSQFIEELQFWDGCTRGSGSIIYCNNNLSCIEKVRLFATMCGYRSHVTVVNGGRGYRVLVQKKDFVSGRILNKEMCQYKGKVYCVTVPSGYILVRRSGNTMVTGNSYKYIAEQSGLDEAELFSQHLSIESMKAKAKLARDLTGNIQAYASNKEGYAEEELLAGVFFYSQCYEGCWFMGGFAPLFSLCESGEMLATGKQLEMIWRDENLHVQGWTEWLRVRQQETGIRLKQGTAHLLMNTAIGVEVDYAEECFPSTTNYSPKVHAAYMRHLANMRLTVLGYDKLYKDSECAFPPWLSQYQTQKEGNFFESRIVNYQSGGVLDGTW